jgi:hypothetical protein
VEVMDHDGDGDQQRRYVIIDVIAHSVLPPLPLHYIAHSCFIPSFLFGNLYMKPLF